MVPKKFERKYEGKKIENKNIRKIKNKFKVNKLFLYITSNFFHRFNSSIYELNNLKIYKNFNNLTFFCIFHNKTKHEKMHFLLI